MGVMNADAVMKNIIPVVMAGVLGIYGLIIAVILVQGSQTRTLTSAPATPCLPHSPLRSDLQSLFSSVFHSPLQSSLRTPPSLATLTWLPVCRAVCPVSVRVWPSASSATPV